MKPRHDHHQVTHSKKMQYGNRIIQLRDGWVVEGNRINHMIQDSFGSGCARRIARFVQREIVLFSGRAVLAPASARDHAVTIG